jgi:DNA polymerase-3 subunit delta'
MNDIVHTSLMKKLQAKELASLYLVTYNSETTDPHLWVDQFQKDLTPLADHPDILKVNKAPKENEYKVDSPGIKDFLKFISTRALQLEKKFIFLFDAQDLSVIVSNKLLKVFEELSSDYCLILFSPRNATLLDTVLSRAVKLALPESKSTADNSDQFEVEFASLNSPQDLVAFLKENDGDMNLEKKYIEYALKQCLAQKNFQHLDQMLAVLREYETRSTFNNSRLSRLTPFFP